MTPSPKASIAIAAALRSRIARGALGPGDPLPVEDELTAELGCSKPVVREALRILETEGLVEVRRGVGGGARVRHPSISDAAKTMGVYLQIGDVPVLDVWTARDHIIADAVERLAAQPAPAVAELEAAVADLAAAVGDLAAFNRSLLDVGEVAVVAAGNVTAHVLVVALRHIVDAEVTAAASRVEDAAGLEQAVGEEHRIADAWARALGHIRTRRARAARAAYEEHAASLRALVGGAIDGVNVGDAAARR